MQKETFIVAGKAAYLSTWQTDIAAALAVMIAHCGDG